MVDLESDSKQKDERVLSLLSKIDSELGSIKKRQDIFFERQLNIEKEIKEFRKQQEADKKEIKEQVFVRTRFVSFMIGERLEGIFGEYVHGKKPFVDLTDELADAFNSVFTKINKMQRDVDYLVRKP